MGLGLFLGEGDECPLPMRCYHVASMVPQDAVVATITFSIGMLEIRISEGEGFTEG